MSRRGNGEGSIYQMKDGRWRAAVSNGFKNGVPQRKVYTGSTRSEVAGKLARALRDQQQGVPFANERATVGAFMKSWLEDVAAPRVRPATLRMYSYMNRIYVTPILGARPLAKLTPEHIRAMLLHTKRYRASGPKKEAENKPKEKLSPATQKHVLTFLRNALSTAVKDGTIPRNVALLVDPPRAAKKELTIFTPEQAKVFVGVVSGDRLEALFTSAVALGLRQGEILGLEWSAIDFDLGELTVRSALQRVDGELVKVEPKSKTSRRKIGLPAVVISSLRKHQTTQQAEREWAVQRGRNPAMCLQRPSGPLLTDETSAGDFTQSWKTPAFRESAFMT